MAQPFTGEIYMPPPGEAHYDAGGDGACRLRTKTSRNWPKAKLTATSPDLFERSGTQSRLGPSAQGRC